MNFFKKAKRKRKEKAAKMESIRLRTSILACQYQDYAINRTDPGVSQSDTNSLLVSLTTFNKRINDVHLVVESVFQQSLKANKVVLWISAQEFSWSDIPAALRKQCDRGLEIEFCEEDLGPYTKFYYAFKKYPDHLVLTVDDDVLYPSDMIDILYRAYRKDPAKIYCNRAHQMKVGDDGKLMPYLNWNLNSAEFTRPSLVFPTGVGGVLYFPNCFDAEVLNKEAFLKLAPKADDVWLKAMSLRKGTPACLVSDGRDWSQRFLFVEGSQKYALKHENLQDDFGNDQKIAAVFDAYDLWALL